MKFCLMILSVPWYMFNELEHTAILSCASLALQVATVSYHCLFFFIGLRSKLGNTYYHIIWHEVPTMVDIAIF
jgi:hypothetical protein